MVAKTEIGLKNNTGTLSKKQERNMREDLDAWKLINQPLRFLFLPPLPVPPSSVDESPSQAKLYGDGGVCDENTLHPLSTTKISSIHVESEFDTSFFSGGGGGEARKVELVRKEEGEEKRGRGGGGEEKESEAPPKLSRTVSHYERESIFKTLQTTLQGMPDCIEKMLIVLKLSLEYELCRKSDEPLFQWEDIDLKKLADQIVVEEFHLNDSVMTEFSLLNSLLQDSECATLQDWLASSRGPEESLQSYFSRRPTLVLDKLKDQTSKILRRIQHLDVEKLITYLESTRAAQGKIEGKDSGKRCCFPHWTNGCGQEVSSFFRSFFSFFFFFSFFLSFVLFLLFFLSFFCSFFLSPIQYFLFS